MAFTIAHIFEKSTNEAVSFDEFEGLMRQTQKQAFSLAYRLTGNMTEAEDLLQDAYIRAFRFFNRYDRSMPFASWLFRIVTNAHIDTVRRKTKLKISSLDQGGVDGTKTMEVEDSTSAPDAVLTNSSVNEYLQRALDSMNHEFKMAVILADVEGMAYEEIADIMRTSIGTVRSRIHRGRKHLKSHLLKSAPGLYERYCNELL